MTGRSAKPQLTGPADWQSEAARGNGLVLRYCGPTACLAEVRNAHLSVIHLTSSSAISRAQHSVDWAESGPSPRSHTSARSVRSAIGSRPAANGPEAEAESDPGKLFDIVALAGAAATMTLSRDLIHDVPTALVGYERPSVLVGSLSSRTGPQDQREHEVERHRRPQERPVRKAGDPEVAEVSASPVL